MGLLNPFHSPLGFGAAYSRPTVHETEHALLPTQTDLDDPTYADEPFNGSPLAQYGNMNDTFQHDDSTPFDSGQYELRFRSDMGLTSELNSHLLPAPGSANLTAPRDSGGVPGMNRVIASVGPVRGESDATYRNARQKVVPNNVGQQGPVTGSDYSQALHNAYYQQVNAAYNQAAAESAMVAAV